MTARVLAPVTAEPMAGIWHAVMDLHEALPEGWTVIGGQMASLHSWERGTGNPRPTQDVDAGLHYREIPEIGVTATRALKDLGFTAVLPGTDAPAVRWERDGHQFDVLIPKHAGRSHLDVNRRRLLESHGVQQALDRTEVITLVVGGREGLIPRPTLYGSVIAKAAAFSNQGDPDKRRHAEDLVELVSMLTPDDLDTELRRRDMAHMRIAQGYLLRDASPYDSLALREQLGMYADAYWRQRG